MENSVEINGTYYHGTSQDFNKFQQKHCGLSTQAITAKLGHWFTHSKEEALAYARLSGKALVNNQPVHERKVERLLDEIERAENRGDWDLAEKKTHELEELESSALHEASEQYLFTCILSVKNAMVVDMREKCSSQGLLEHIKKAKKLGHDGVVFMNISDHPEDAKAVTQHVVVFSASSISITSKQKINKEQGEKESEAPLFSSEDGEDAAPCDVAKRKL